MPHAPKKKRRRSHSAVTLHDVARHIGVSPMTVSRVIGGQANVSEATRTRVTAAIEKLGYFPDPVARTLAGATTLKIGLLYGNPSATFTAEFLVGLFESIGRTGGQVVLEKSAASRGERAAAQRLIGAGVQGVLLPTPMCDSSKLLEQFEAVGLPTVAVGTGRSDVRGLSLRIDNVRAAQMMTEHLIALGHRDIGFIRGHPRQVDSEQRYAGYAAALEDAGLRLDPKRVTQGQYTYQSGLLAAEELLKHRSRPTAIFASNDDMAAGALATAHRLKLDVPRDLTLVGFDDTPLATTIWPTLTTVRQPVDELIRRALVLLVDEIRARRGGRVATQHQEVLQLTLIKRESSAPPSGR